MKPGEAEDTARCAGLSEMLSRIGDKWTLLVIRQLGSGSKRFNALKREIGDISQKMLASTLRNLERDGFVTRTVLPVNPPQVDYALTELGHDLRTPVTALAEWASRNSARIEMAREAFDNRGRD